MKALVMEDIQDDVINIEHGWWFPEKPPPDFGVCGSNANLLTSNVPPYDPMFSTYQPRGLPPMLGFACVQSRKLEAGHLD
jgi:hypothetical protein